MASILCLGLWLGLASDVASAQSANVLAVDVLAVNAMAIRALPADVLYLPDASQSAQPEPGDDSREASPEDPNSPALDSTFGAASPLASHDFNAETPSSQVLAHDNQDQTSSDDSANADGSSQGSDEDDSFSVLLQHLFDDFASDEEELDQNPALSSLKDLDLSGYEIPVTITPEVERWLEFFSVRGRVFFTGWLARSNRFLPRMEAEFEAAGLPRELMYVAMIESGFANGATSRMGAGGMWQFMTRTAKAEGLKVERWVDERRDPIKATRAAARHFESLYNRFGDWYLALAAYNAGAGRVAGAIDRYNTADFWTLARKHAFRPETCNYVPRLLAAMLIAENPARFGFYDIPYLDTLQFETIDVPEATPLGVLAATMGVDAEALADLNPELVRNQTPPGSYTLYVPQGAARVYEARKDDLNAGAADVALAYRQHRIHNGETLDKIARYYGVSVKELRSMNGLKSDRLRAGEQLTVPLPDTASEGQVQLAAADTEAPKSGRRTQMDGKTHQVQSGDTLWSIARRYTVDVDDLRSVNHLPKREVLAVGQMLDIPRR